jgi:hypothetical protein
MPEGTYMASGGRGQSVLISPRTNTVIVRRATDVSRRHIDNESDRVMSRFDMERFSRDVLAVLLKETER